MDIVANWGSTLPTIEQKNSIEIQALKTVAQKLPGNLSLIVSEALLDLSDSYKQEGKIQEEEACIERAYEIVRQYVKEQPELLAQARSVNGMMSRIQSSPSLRFEF